MDHHPGSWILPGSIGSSCWILHHVSICGSSFWILVWFHHPGYCLYVLIILDPGFCQPLWVHYLASRSRSESWALSCGFIQPTGLDPGLCGCIHPPIRPLSPGGPQPMEAIEPPYIPPSTCIYIPPSTYALLDCSTSAYLRLTFQMATPSPCSTLVIPWGGASI